MSTSATALLVLIHVLVFVYWLGGDLGAFLASFVIADARLPVAARSAAMKIMAHVDMAPRTCLILALPTGIVLADAKGWLDLRIWMLAAIGAVSAIWLGIAWVLHFTEAGHMRGLRIAEVALRVVTSAGLLLASALSLTRHAPIPLFIGGKFFVLGAAMLSGLAIRRAAAPFRPAFAATLRDGASAATDDTIARTLRRTRAIVLLLWGLLLVAAFLGITTPV